MTDTEQEAPLKPGEEPLSHRYKSHIQWATSTQQ